LPFFGTECHQGSEVVVTGAENGAAAVVVAMVAMMTKLTLTTG